MLVEPWLLAHLAELADHAGGALHAAVAALPGHAHGGFDEIVVASAGEPEIDPGGFVDAGCGGVGP